MFHIAFSGALSPANILFLKHLAVKGNRLLLAHNETFSEAFIEKLHQQIPGADIEIASCLKDGCWEADVIILSSEIISDKQALRNIKEVATQKQVICLSEVNNSEEFYKLKQLLPNSKIALVQLNPKMKKSWILMTSEGAEFKKLLEEINYTLVPENQEI